MARGSKNERELVAALDEKALWDAIRPAIKAIVSSGSGSALNLLKKSEAIAAVTLLNSLASEKDDVRLKAAIELLNRSLGKPVERRIDIQADFASLSEPELDTQIKTLMSQLGEKATIDEVFRQMPNIARKRRRPIAKQYQHAQKIKQSKRTDVEFDIIADVSPQLEAHEHQPARSEGAASEAAQTEKPS